MIWNGAVTAQNNAELNGRFEWGWRALGDREQLESVVFPDTYGVLSGKPTSQSDLSEGRLSIYGRHKKIRGGGFWRFLMIRGRNQPTLTIIFKLAHTLNIELSKLIKLVQTRQKHPNS